MRYNKLGATGIEVSELSLGGATFSDIYGVWNEDKSIQLIKESFKRGVNYIETGPWYGQGTSERTVGKALKDIPRSSYYIGEKVGRYEMIVDKMFDFSAEKVEASLENSLKLLGLNYVDVIQVHDPTFAPDISIILKETLPALERAVKDGKARYIGIADYDLDLLKEIVEESEVKISTVLTFAKSTLIDNRLQNYTNFFKNKGIAVINGSVTGMGILTNNGPQVWHPASAEVKAICKQASDYCKSQNVELGNLATWFALNQPDISTNIVGCTSLAQIVDCLNIVDKGISDHEKKVFEHIQERFFNNVTLHWDGVQLQEYKDDLKKKLGK